MRTLSKRAPALLVLALTTSSLGACARDLPTGPELWADAYGDLALIPAGIVERTNRERQANGFAPLAMDERLAQAARIQAEQMAVAGRVDHTLPEAPYPTLASRVQAAGYPSSRVAENIAAGYWNVESLMEGWMNSAGHRSNILHSEIREIGVAVAVATNGRIYYASVFGIPR